QRFYHLAFTDQLVTMKANRTRLEILKAIGNLTRYLDIKNDTSLHDEYIHWMKRKEIKWSVSAYTNNYESAKNLDINYVVESLKKLPRRYAIFGLFTLVTGLRSSEAVKAFNNHSDLCNDHIMELFWDRRTKKANAVFCLPIIHDQIDFTISRKVYKFINKRRLGFDLRYLRKVNFTVNVSKVDPLLSEFTQGRRGNISQRHYFLPSMYEHKSKWLATWNSIIRQIN
ncbi:MAG: hypothetical protein AUI92_01335, partial [Thaumarchaeota archaeon 13_1_40CM_3_38_6]